MSRRYAGPRDRGGVKRCIHASMRPCSHASTHPCNHAAMRPGIRARMHATYMGVCVCACAWYMKRWRATNTAKHA
eukprot:1916200-Alexandrium_andersonii.AAC.1